MAPVSAGFELESEMCLRAGRHHLMVTDVPIPYAVRQAPSKLRGFTHGWAIARFIILESADLLFILPGILGILLGIVSLAIRCGGQQGRGRRLGEVAASVLRSGSWSRAGSRS